MKNLKNIILCSTLVLTISVVSCEDDLLVEDPKLLTIEGFYNTTDEVEAGLAAIYSPLRGMMSGWWLGILITHTEWGAGYTGSANFDSYRSMQGLSNVGANNLVSRWNSFYESIRNANLVIRHTPESEILTQEQIDLYVAEARFLRGFAYFQLVRAWGGVPIYTEENMDETTGAPRATQEQVYELITSDIEFAENQLPDDAPVLGRPSTWVAKTVLADVYLFRELYAQASETALEVIQSGKFSLEQVSEPNDFNNLFGLTANSPEEIFYLKYNDIQPSQLILFTQAIQTPWFGTNGFGIYFWHDQAELYTTWDDDDFRKVFNWYELEIDNPFLSGQPFFPTEGVTILDSKKYNAPEAVRAAFDLPVYRFADVLMIYAEASARENGNPIDDSMEKLNMVHRRAYGNDPNQPSLVDFNISEYSDLESFIALVTQEQGYEFQMEGKRWFFLKRTGELNRIMEAIGRPVVEKHLLWPIPAIEFDLNEALSPSDQNPGY